MNGLRKIMVPCLAFLLIIGNFSGCQGKTSNSNSLSSSVTKTSSNTAESSAEPIPLKIFAGFSTANETKVDKAWQKEVEKACNVKISWEIPPASGYNERQQVMLAGGNYPDIVLFNDPTAKIFTDAVKNGVVIPITKYINNSPNIKKYSYDYSLDALKVNEDDEIYGIPRTTIQRGDGFIIRKDWCDTIGFKIPEDNLLTIDQFKDLMIKFTREDPDKNGKNDTYGWGASSNEQGNLGPIMGYAFGDLGWQKAPDGSKYEYIDTQHNPDTKVYKKILQFNQDLFKAGAMDPNAPSIRFDAAKQRFKQGVTGAYGEFSGWISQYVSDMTKVNPKSKLTYISGIKNEAGKFQETSFGTGLWGFWAVTSSCKQPDAAVKLFDYLLSDEGWPITEYGTKGVSYTEENGVKKPTEDYGEFAQNGWARCMVRRNNDPSFFVGLDMPDEFKEPVTKWIDIAIKAKISSLDYGFRPEAADNPALIDYNTRISQSISKIITGAAPVDSWDQTLEGWYKAGGEDYVKQMNEHIKKLQSK